MAKSQRKQSKTTSKRPFPWHYLIIFFILAAAIGVFWFVRNRPGASGEQSETNQEAAAAPAPTASPYGGASYCQARPAFINGIEMEGQAIIGTSVTGFVGFTLADQLPNGDIAYVFQHPSWSAAGNLGAYTRDGEGNIYVAPAPFSSVELNPPEEQTILHIIPSQEGIMAPYLEVPAAQAPTEQNPFGVMGLFFDCDTNSLYAASIAGSTAQDEVGRIVRIDTANREIVGQLDGIDALGIAVHNGAGGKRLYYGLARNSAVMSIALDEAGNFSGEPRQEFFLAGLPGGGNDKAQRITFTQDDGQMVIKGVQFDYTLRSSSETERMLYTFTYLPSEDTWELDSVERTDEPVSQ